MFLTERQHAVLEFLREFREARGLSPTLDEIARNFGITRATAAEHVKALELKGALRTSPRRARSIQLVAPHRAPGSERSSSASPVPTLSLPVLGRIAAGLPIEALSDTSTLDLGALLPAERGGYVLRVKGNSMIEDQIRDGDYVLVEPCPSPEPGAIVVALIDGVEATLKRFYPEGDRIRLEPANAALRALVIDRNRVTIQGIVRGLVRPRL